MTGARRVSLQRYPSMQGDKNFGNLIYLVFLANKCT